MAVKQTGFDQWHSSLLNHTFTSEMAAKHYEAQELQRMSADSPGAKLLDSLSAEQLRSLITELNVQSDQTARIHDWRQVQQDFVDANPDYLPTPANGAALGAVLVERGKIAPDGTFLGTMADMQAAYTDLANQNVIQLRPGAKRPKRFNEEEAYELPMGELMNKAFGL